MYQQLIKLLVAEFLLDKVFDVMILMGRSKSFERGCFLESATITIFLLT